MSAKAQHLVSDALQRAGFSGSIGDADARLADHGVDSLMLALWIVELETEFGIRFSIDEMESDAFATLGGVEALLRRKGKI